MRETIKTALHDWQFEFFPEYFAWFFAAIGLILCGVVVYYAAYVLTRRLLQKGFAASRFAFVRHLSETKLLTYINYLIVAIVINHITPLWFGESLVTQIISILAQIWMLLSVLLIAFAVLDTVTHWYFTGNFSKQLPVRGLAQTAKLLLSIGVGIGVIALLIGQSPFLLLSGLGAMTAVLMLVFKDPILGLVAGIQLSANKMLNVGDWLEMGKYNADGTVIDIGLTTVKVRNWDNTVTTVPTYALISDSFKNWQSMFQSGGRRIKRAIMIDASTIKFISEDDVNHLIRNPILAEYIIAKSKELEGANKETDMSLSLNGRRLTNIGTFRAYVQRYLQQHPKIRHDLTTMVRQLAPTNEGIPLEIYCFSNDVAWVNYEGIQSDIFDHIFAVIGEFGLRIHQSPTGYDMQVGLSK